MKRYNTTTRPSFTWLPFFVCLLVFDVSCEKNAQKGAAPLNAAQVASGATSRLVYEIAPSYTGDSSEALQNLRDQIQVRLSAEPGFVGVFVENTELVVEFEKLDTFNTKRIQDIVEAPAGRLSHFIVDAGTECMKKLALFTKSNEKAQEFGIETGVDSWIDVQSQKEITDDYLASPKAESDSGRNQIKQYLKSIASEFDALGCDSNIHFYFQKVIENDRRQGSCRIMKIN